MTKLTGYVVGDSREPGEYINIGGLDLRCEDCFECRDEEEFVAIVSDLRACGYEESEFVLVQEDEDGWRGIVA